jgi:hypothetical protein
MFCKVEQIQNEYNFSAEPLLKIHYKDWMTNKNSIHFQALCKIGTWLIHYMTVYTKKKGT